MAGEKTIVRLAGQRTALIDRLVAALEKRVESGQSAFLRMLVTDLVDTLDRDGDTVKNTLRNKRLVGMVDTIYNRYLKTHGIEAVASIADGMKKIVDFNGRYFGTFSTPAKMQPIQKQVKESLGAWLGLTERGALEKNGYLDTLIRSTPVKNKIKDMIMGGVVSQKGFFEMKKGLREYLGSQEGQQAAQKKPGAMMQYYRNFVFDTFSVADRTAAKVTADKLGMNYAIYEGGLIKTSREFCKERNGKVFTRAEIAKFDPDEAKQPGYNPFTDLGGYGCRHHLNYIPEVLALALRPDLRNKPAPLTPIQDAIEPVQPKAAKDVQRPHARTPFEELPRFRSTPWKPRTPEEVKAKNMHNLATKKVEDIQRKISAAQMRAHEIPKQLEKAAGRKLIEELEKELQEVYDSFPKLREEKVKLQKEAAKQNEIMKKQLLQGLSRSEVKITNKSSALAKSKSVVKEVDSAVDFFRAAARGYMEEFEIGIEFTNSSRAYASGTNVFLRKDVPARVVVHELSHILEKHNAVMKAAVDFLERRTRGRASQSLRNINRAYRPNEVYKPGDFFNPYVGKIYQDPRFARYKGYYATEVISMGMERMFTDPLDFYRADPDHFNFIYSLFFKR